MSGFSLSCALTTLGLHSTLSSVSLRRLSLSVCGSLAEYCLVTVVGCLTAHGVGPCEVVEGVCTCGAGAGVLLQRKWPRVASSHQKKRRKEAPLRPAHRRQPAPSPSASGARAFAAPQVHARAEARAGAEGTEASTRRLPGGGGST